ncbi:RNA polymerase sigma factor [Asanoa ishikariensis]|uniref:RNA polymerase sigma factor, sigma-70 family n=1 Tax=Asanoa ishikariensis TaxID=137265 RepID=A0A1H3TE18_9ACTN|nr:sigma-70 family RNA polymerase sigma factor [Asanoa ishikariensis]GIF62727.1 RNA polymerase sigma factor [Asanoa ishikariensis]SDZ47599.1 RNA polymerase sigma factor, sigma-70 family [Asanoa ishikariensis]
MRDDPSVVDLVERARHGDARAWDALVDRYAPLVWAICRRFGLGGADAEDVAASVWLRLVERLDTIREPAALPGWLATTVRRECLTALRGRRHQVLVGDESNLDSVDEPAFEELLLTQERHIALRAAFDNLPEHCRHLLTLLFDDPPAPYAQISSRTGTPVGAIGPTRRRCLDRLRRDPTLAAVVGVEQS